MNKYSLNNLIKKKYLKTNSQHGYFLNIENWSNHGFKS